MCHLHNGREEIVESVTRIAGRSPAVERARAMRRSAAFDLRITKLLTDESGVGALRCGILLAGTMANDDFYGRGVIQHPQKVLLLAYEVPLVDDADQSLPEMLRRIHAN